MRSFFLLVALFPIVFSGCESRRETTEAQSHPAHSEAAPILTEPMDAPLLELPSEAISLWREHRGDKPALVLFSSDPFLQPIPKEVHAEVRKLTLEGSTAEIKRRGPFNASTLLLSNQAVSAALDAGFFSRIVWVVPKPDADRLINIDATKTLLLDTDVMTAEEAKTFAPTTSGFKAKIRGVPLEATDFRNLPEIEGPVVIHFDLTFVRDSYKNEIKTPLYRLLFDTLQKLQETRWAASTVTVSLSTSMEIVSLDARYLGPQIQSLFLQPDLLEGQIPTDFAIRRDILYLENFFQHEKILQLYQSSLNRNPEDPSTHFGLYRTHMHLKNPDEAYQFLAQAVEKDKGYAVEYVQLAAQAVKNADQDAAIRHYSKALDAFPENPFLRLTLAQLYMQTGQFNSAQSLLQPLKKLTWSPTYHHRIPGIIQRLDKQTAAVMQQ